ncbi:hypothetical protein Tco_0280407, partial [Tanacetum coccineum]
MSKEEYERDGDKPEVPDVPKYRSESEEVSWTYSQGEDDEDNHEHDSENDNDDEDDDQENVSRETESDNDGDDFVHSNLSTYKENDQEEEKANDDDDVSSDQMVSTPPDYEITEEEENQEDDDNVMGGEQEDEEDEELVSSLETELSELKQTNQFTEVVSSILSSTPDEVNVAIQLKLNKLKEEAQAENEECLNKIESNIKVEKFVTESLGAEVLSRSSNQPQTSYAAVASLSEFELKMILIDKI